MEQVSLHRVIAEIKNLEVKLVQPQQVVAVASKKDGLVNMTNEQFEAKSQGAVDQFVANVDRLQKLKVARNLANATNMVSISGQTMTLDAAIARKATAQYTRNFVDMIKQQINHATVQVTQASNEVERKIEAQVQAIGGSTKKVSDEELKAIRAMIEKSTGKEIVMGKNVKAFIESASEELDKFLLEVDFALSEANASIKVEV